MQKNIGASLEQVGGAWNHFAILQCNLLQRINNQYPGMIKNTLDWATLNRKAVQQE